LKYFHGVVCNAVAQSTGDSPWEVKKDFKKKFLGKFDEVDGIRYCWIPSLEDLTMKEMSAFIDKCIIDAMNRPNPIFIPPAELYEPEIPKKKKKKKRRKKDADDKESKVLEHGPEEVLEEGKGLQA
jgi:hypothetical protein